MLWSACSWEAQKKFGAEGCYVAPEHAQTHYGVPVKNFALEYLLCSTVLPMERIIELSGPFGSGKSSLGYDFLRMIAEHGGLGSIVETENKSAGALMQSILGEECGQCVRLHRAKSMDDGQARITHELMTYQQAVPDKDIPMGLMLDSLVGNKTQETQAKINKDGFADRTFSKEALIISSYFGSLSDKLIGYPILFMFTNHEKEKVSDGPIYGSKIRNPGGSAPDFHNTYHIRVTKTGSFTSKIDNGFTVKLQTKKNSMGSDKRSIEVDMRWIYKPQDDGSIIQQTWFDWDKATAALLASEEIPRSIVKDICQVTKINNTKYNCTTLNLSGVSPQEVGAAINADEEICKKLRAALGVFTWRTM
jgi:hypothetical protein